MNVSPVIKKDLLWGAGIAGVAIIFVRIYRAQPPQTAVMPDPSNTSALNPYQTGWLAGAGASPSSYGGQTPIQYTPPIGNSGGGSPPNPPSSGPPAVLPIARGGGGISYRPGMPLPVPVPIGRPGVPLPGNCLPGAMPGQTGYCCPTRGQPGYGTHPGCPGYVPPSPTPPSHQPGAR